MRIIIKKHENYGYANHIAVPTTKLEKAILKAFKYDLLDEYGSLELSRCSEKYQDLLYKFGYFENGDGYARTPSNLDALLMGLYLMGKHRKLRMLKRFNPVLFNPPGFHDYSHIEYDKHLQWLDSLMGDV